MAGYLGTEAPFASDLSLTFAWIFFLVAVFGAINGRRRRISRHCPLMATAALLNWIPTLVVMIPKWLDIAARKAGAAAGIESIAPLGHGVLGAVTQSLITYTVMRMYWVEGLPPRRPIWLMRIAIFAWTLTVLGGTVVYMTLYVN